MAIKFHDIKPLNDEAMPYAEDPYYPREHFKESELPELKDKKLGDEVQFVYKGKIKEITQILGKENRFEIEKRAVGLLKKKK